MSAESDAVGALCLSLRDAWERGRPAKATQLELPSAAGTSPGAPVAGQPGTSPRPAGVEPKPAVRDSRPSESAITEGNLAELPIFVLSNKEAKRLGAGAQLDQVRLADYTKVLRVSDWGSVTIEASPKHGFPTMFAYRVLLVVLDAAQRGGLSSRVVHLSRYDIATRLGYKQPGRAVYEDIENALRALSAVKLEFRDAWYQRANDRGRRGALGFTGLVSDFQFENERLGGAEDSSSGAAGPLQRRSFIELGLRLFESLQARYLVGVDLDYVNALKSPLAQRLYVYLTKHDKGPVHVEGIRSLASKLGLAKTAPSAIKAALQPALAALSGSVVVDALRRSQRFLDSASIDDARQQVRVVFFRRARENAPEAIGSGATQERRSQVR